MTAHANEAVIVCPHCGTQFETWVRRGVSEARDKFSQGYLIELTHKACPECEQLVDIGSLVVQDGVLQKPMEG